MSKSSYMKKGVLPFVLFGASSLLLSGCGQNESLNSLGSQSYTQYCQVDSSFDFSGGSDLAAFLNRFSDGDEITVAYAKTADAAIVASKQYFALRADGAYVPVAEPVAGSLADYYEKGSDDAIEAVFEAGSSRDIYPNALTYHYLDAADYLTQGSLDWYKDVNTYDHTDERTKTYTRYSSPDSLMLEAAVSYSSDGYFDFNKDGGPEVARLSKSGEFQLTRTGSCALEDQIVSAYRFSAASKSIAGVSATADPAAYDYKFVSSYSHALYADNLTLAHSLTYLSTLESYLKGTSDFVDATALPSFLDQVGGQYSYSASCFQEDGVKGFRVAFKEQRISLDDKNTSSDSTDDETIKDSLAVTYVAKGESVSSFFVEGSTTSRVGGSAERLLASHEESYEFAFDPAALSFTGSLIDSAAYEAKSGEDLTF